MGHVANLRAALGRQKAVDDPLLNRMGLQVGRTVAAHGVARVRRSHAPADPQVAAWARELRAEGCVEVPDFLPPDAFAAVRTAALAVLDPQTPRDVVHPGGNRLDVVWRSDAAEALRRDLDLFFCDARVVALASAAEHIEVEPGGGRCTVQHLTQQAGEPDLEASLHSDTFHPTHKMWLYLTDVTEADGPLVYVPRSHRLSGTSLAGVYRESTRENEGSRRIGDVEVERRRLDAKVFTCAANTMVMADTFGYHGRIQGRPPGERTALHIEWRPDPFRRGKVLATDRSLSNETRRARADD